MDVVGDPIDFQPTYQSLLAESGHNKPLIDAIQNVIEQLHNDIVVGNHVRRVQIPKYYIKKHGVQTLFRVELPHHWRLIYTIISLSDNEKRALILEIFDHDSYNKRFGYFKKK